MWFSTNLKYITFHKLGRAHGLSIASSGVKVARVELVSNLNVRRLVKSIYNRAPITAEILHIFKVLALENLASWILRQLEISQKWKDTLGLDVKSTDKPLLISSLTI